MASSDYFLDRETDHWRITATGSDRQNAFVTLQSKRSGEVIAHITRHALTGHGRSYAWWDAFLNHAERLQGDALNDHLSSFLPLKRLDPDLRIAQDPWLTLSGKFNGSSETPLTVATMLNITNPRDAVEMAQLYREALDSLESYPPTLKDADRASQLSTLKHVLNDLHESLQADIAHGRKSFHEQKVTHQLIDMAKPLGLLESGRAPYEQTIVFRNLVTAMHFETQPIHMGQGRIDLSSAHLLPFMERDDPYIRAVQAMVMGEAPLISDQELADSGLFGGANAVTHNQTLYSPPSKPNRFADSYKPNRFAGSYRRMPESRSVEHYNKAGAALALNLLSGCQSPEEKRNVFQFFKAFDFHPSIINASHLGSDTLKGRWNDIKRGVNISALLWSVHEDYANQGRHPLSFEKDKFGKKEARLLIDNLIGLHRIDACAIEGEIKTMHGERLVISPYSRAAMQGTDAHGNPDPSLGVENFDWHIPRQKQIIENFASTSRYAHVKFTDSAGRVTFGGHFNLQELPAQTPLAFVMMDVPPGTLTRVEHLFALSAVASNPVLAQDMVAGGLQLRDKQIRKSQDYNGAWTSMIHRIDTVLERHDCAGSTIATELALDKEKLLEPYQHDTRVSDTKHILTTVLNALKASYLTGIESRFSDVDAMIDAEEPDTHILRIYDDFFELEKSAVLPSLDRLAYNAKLELADKAHKDYNALRKAASPDVSLEWTPALPEITLEVPGQSPITLTHLTSHADVTQEGDDMAHCVGSYANRCVRGEYLVFSVSQNGEKIATLGMEAGGNSAEFDQFQGYRNSSIDDAVHTVVMDQFVQPLEEYGAVDAHELEIATPEGYKNPLTRRQLLSLQMDFEVFDDTKMAHCRNYLMNLLAREEIAGQIEAEIDRVVDHFTSHRREQAMPGFFTAELRQLERNRERLWEDFAVAPRPDLAR